jgi:hypothetical protein
MATVTIKGAIYFDASSMQYSKDLSFSFFRGLPSDIGGYTPVCAHEITFELPPGWSPESEELKALEKEKASVTAAFQAKVRAINERISKLQAIGYEPAEAA